MTERKCAGCGGPIRADNRTGYCRQNKTCAAIAEQIQRGLHAAEPTCHPEGWHTPWESPVSPLVNPGAVPTRATSGKRVR